MKMITVLHRPVVIEPSTSFIPIPIFLEHLKLKLFRDINQNPILSAHKIAVFGKMTVFVFEAKRLKTRISKEQV